MDEYPPNDFLLPSVPTIYKSRQTDTFVKQTTQQHMLEHYGDEVVILASSNSYSYDKKEMKFKEYMEAMNVQRYDAGRKEDHVFDQKTSKGANETFYMFGDNYKGVWEVLASMYTLPGCLGCSEAGLSTIGVGGKNSGVSFHMHGYVSICNSLRSFPSFDDMFVIMYVCLHQYNTGRAFQR